MSTAGFFENTVSRHFRRPPLLRVALWAFGLTLGAALGQTLFGTAGVELRRGYRQAARPLHVVAQPMRPIDDTFLQPFPPLPDVFERQKMRPLREEAALGKAFFFDKRFSRNHELSCNSCHPLDSFGMDGRGVSIGHVGQTGRRNAPTVYNAAGQAFQFWDGRARDVEEQAAFPLLDPFEMAMDPERVLQTLRSIPEYVAELKRVFPNESDPVTVQNFAYVIGAFERTLVTPSRWDRFVMGDTEALNEEEQRGFIVFNQLGCVSCHTGALVGGNQFAVLGQARPWPNQLDLGNGMFSGMTRPVPMFKVASLRNVTKTAPYFHDASSETLEDAVRRMAEHQLGVAVTNDQVNAVVTWLDSLTGELPAHVIAEPELPPSTDETPKPERDGY